MNLGDWIPAVTTTSLLAAVLWLMRSLIVTRLTKSVQHEFDGRLEHLRLDLRKSEESFKAELRSKEAQITSLRGGALAGLASRQAALDRRRIDAVDELWAAIGGLSSAKAASSMMAVVNFDRAAVKAAEDPRLREMFAALDSGFGAKNMQSQCRQAWRARPFISPLAWALFCAYHAIVSLAVLRLHFLKSGLTAAGAIDTDAIANLIKVALPHRAETITTYGVNAAHYFLEELELQLLEELQKVLRGCESDRDSLEQAAAIVREAEQLNELVSQSGQKTMNGEGPACGR